MTAVAFVAPGPFVANNDSRELQPHWPKMTLVYNL